MQAPDGFCEGVNERDENPTDFSIIEDDEAADILNDSIHTPGRSTSTFTIQLGTPIISSNSIVNTTEKEIKRKYVRDRLSEEPRPKVAKYLPKKKLVRVKEEFNKSRLITEENNPTNVQPALNVDTTIVNIDRIQSLQLSPIKNVAVISPVKPPRLPELKVFSIRTKS